MRDAAATRTRLSPLPKPSVYGIPRRKRRPVPKFRVRYGFSIWDSGGPSLPAVVRRSGEDASSAPPNQPSQADPSQANPIQAKQRYRQPSSSKPRSGAAVAVLAANPRPDLHAPTARARSPGAGSASWTQEATRKTVLSKKCGGKRKRRKYRVPAEDTPRRVNRNEVVPARVCERWGR